MCEFSRSNESGDSASFNRLLRWNEVRPRMCFHRRSLRRPVSGVLRTNRL